MCKTIPSTMKAAVIREAGGPEKLTVEEVPVPRAKPGWSLVRVRGFGINHSEIFTRKGLSPSVQFPRILGIECVGEVAESTEPDRLSVGQRVVSIMGEMGRAFDGGYAEWCLLPNEQICPVSWDGDWATLAAIPETYYTAWLSFNNLRISEGNRVLVRGGTSGVGIAFLRLVRASGLGLVVSGTSRSASKSQRLLDAGFDTVVVDSDGKLQTEGQFDRVLELIGPKTLKDSCQHTVDGGIVCSTGQLGGQWYMDDDFDPIMDLPHNGYLTSAYSGNVNPTLMQALLDYIKERGVDVAPERVFALDEVADAHRYLEGSHSFGKVVCVTE